MTFFILMMSTSKSSGSSLAHAQRKRHVTRPESNGGVSCPDLHQTRVCHVACPEPKLAALEMSATDINKPRRLSGRKHKISSAVRGRYKYCLCRGGELAFIAFDFQQPKFMLLSIVACLLKVINHKQELVQIK